MKFKLGKPIKGDKPKIKNHFTTEDKQAVYGLIIIVTATASITSIIWWFCL